MEIRSYLKDNILLFDGGMGTCYAARNNTAADACEWASLTNPGEIEAIHRAYLDVGCNAIKTNTYGRVSSVVLGNGSQETRLNILGRDGTIGLADIMQVAGG